MNDYYLFLDEIFRQLEEFFVAKDQNVAQFLIARCLFTKYNNFLWVCWYLGKNLSKFYPFFAAELLRQLEEFDANISALQKTKIQLTSQLEEAKRLCDEESKERQSLMGRFRTLEHEFDGNYTLFWSQALPCGSIPVWSLKRFMWHHLVAAFRPEGHITNDIFWN